MYNQHFGLQRSPFKITPDTGLFFPGSGRGEILDALVYAITSGEGIIKVVGEVGTGKTMLCRMLETRLPGNVEIVYLANPSLSPEDILYAIALEMGLEFESGANRIQVLHVIQKSLLEKHAENRHIVVLVEEAQSMPKATLEEIRLLSNLETEQDKLLQIVLFGQPELDEMLRDPSIRQLRERITHSFELQPFDPEDVRSYVSFRLRQVGYKGREAFRDNAYAAMAGASQGLVRRINILADKSLLAAYADDTHDVSRRHVRKAIDDSRFEVRRRFGWPGFALACGALLVVAAGGWLLHASTQRDAVDAQAGVAAVSEPVAVADAPSAAPSAGATAPVAEPAPAPAPPATEDVAAAAAPREPAPAAGPAAGATVIESGSGLMLSESLVASAPRDAAPAPAATVPGPAAEATGGETETPEPEAPPQAGVQVPPEAPVEAATDAGVPADAPAPAAPEPVAAAVQAAAEPPPVTEEAPADLGSRVEPQPAGPAADPDPGAASLVDQRLDATRDWLAGANRDHYSIQLLLTDVTRRPNLEEFLRGRARAGELKHVFVYETVINERTWFGVLYREYPTFSAAREALEKLPPELSRHQPFIRNVRDIAALG